MKRHAFLFQLILVLVVPGTATCSEDLSLDVKEVVTEAQSSALKLQVDGRYWNLPLSMGPNYVSEYYLFLHWLGGGTGSFDVPRFKQILLDSQLGDGSWQPVRDRNLESGSLDATIANYWALKVIGLDVNSDTLIRARQFILAKGGIPKSSLFMKIFLALFRNYDWYDLPEVPSLLFKGSFLVSAKSFAQWVRPHLLPIAYLSGRMVSKNKGELFHLAELGAPDVEKMMRKRMVGPHWELSQEKGHRMILVPPRRARVSRSESAFLAKTLLKQQLSQGSWGGTRAPRYFRWPHWMMRAEWV